jgi:hypothetical protein
VDNYTAVRDGLHAVVATVAGIKDVLDYEPDMVQVHPLAWITLDSFERAGAPAGQIGRRLRFMVRVVAPVQNSKAAEDELIFVAMMVGDAVERDKQFSGVITKGLAVPPDGRVGWINVGAVKCRVVDIFVSAYCKYDY